MPCTTVLAGKKATYDGSTFAARNEDSPSGMFGAKKFIVVEPKDQPEIYHSVISHVTIRFQRKHTDTQPCRTPTPQKASGQQQASMS